MPLELKELMTQPTRLTLGIAESLTSGWVQARIGSVPGASEFFRGGLTAYELDQKVRHLGIEREHALAVNAVSAKVAEQMAQGACVFFNCDLGLATTGYAEPNAAHGVKEPFAFWALTQVRPEHPPIVQGGRIECVGLSRIQAQQHVADIVLAKLVKYLVRLRG